MALLVQAVRTVDTLADLGTAGGRMAQSWTPAGPRCAPGRGQRPAAGIALARLLAALLLPAGDEGDQVEGRRPQRRIGGARSTAWAVQGEGRPPSPSPTGAPLPPELLAGPVVARWYDQFRRDPYLAHWPRGRFALAELASGGLGMFDCAGPRRGRLDRPAAAVLRAVATGRRRGAP